MEMPGVPPAEGTRPARVPARAPAVRPAAGVQIMMERDSLLQGSGLLPGLRVVPPPPLAGREATVGIAASATRWTSVWACTLSMKTTT